MGTRRAKRNRILCGASVYGKKTGMYFFPLLSQTTAHQSLPDLKYLPFVTFYHLLKVYLRERPLFRQKVFFHTFSPKPQLLRRKEILFRRINTGFKLPVYLQWNIIL